MNAKLVEIGECAGEKQTSPEHDAFCHSKATLLDEGEGGSGSSGSGGQDDDESGDSGDGESFAARMGVPQTLVSAMFLALAAVSVW